jgi:hypothetical protein
MKTLLLDKTDVRYLRRLARELNALPDGFYLVGARCPGNLRCNAASVRMGCLTVRPCGNLGFRAIPSTSEFMDAYGRTVVASRRAGK